MTMNVLDVFEYFESAPVADAERAIKYASRIVTARVGLPHKHATKPASVNGRTRGGQAKPDSLRVKAESVLRAHGAPMGVAAIATAIRVRFAETVKRNSLLSILSRLAVKQDTFSRPQSGMYGLLEWETEAAPPRDQHDDAALFGGDA